ncbi:MAG: alpha/beta hydrolase-fold protein [Myxococcota bacterium]
MPSFAAVYPFHDRDRLTLRGEPDWDVDREPVSRSADRVVFSLEPAPIREVKVVLHRDGQAHWSLGANWIVRGDQDRVAHPVFFDGAGHLTERLQVPSAVLGEPFEVRLFLPAGYHENTARRYVTLYALDGANLFDPAESFSGSEWQLDETLALLDQMSIVDKVLVVGVYARDGRRTEDYTAPGYVATARALVEDLVPAIDAGYRTRAGRESRAILGSSLGGVAALHTLLAHGSVFGAAAALSGTFGWQDDLAERITAAGGVRGKIYLDAGYPNDNFERVRRMAYTLADRGAQLRYVAHPRGLHSEAHWAARLHLPLQYLFGDARH